MKERSNQPHRATIIPLLSIAATSRSTGGVEYPVDQPNLFEGSPHRGQASVSGTHCASASLAQLVERHPCNVQVVGSSPAGGSKVLARGRVL